MITVNLGTLFVIALVAGVGAYFGSYLREKGKNLATKEDVAVISRKAEEIKTEIASGAWLRQRRWDIKWECYSKLAEHLGEMASLLGELIALRRYGAASGLDEKMAAIKEAAVVSAMVTHRRFASIARIVVAPEVRTFLSTFADEFNAAVRFEDKAEAAHKAWIEVLDVARADLLGEPREMQTDAKEDSR